MPIYEVERESGTRQVVGAEVVDCAEAVVPLLERALKHSRGEFTAADILALARRGLCQIWFTDDAKSLLVTELVDYPQKRVCRVLAAAGTMEAFARIADVLRFWAAANGAVEVEAYCRPAVARLARRYGFYPTQREQIVMRIEEVWQ